MGGGTVRAIARIKSSEMIPGPLGIEETSPTASAPASIAVRASSMLPMQHTLTLTRITLRGWQELSRVGGDVGEVAMERGRMHPAALRAPRSEDHSRSAFPPMPV